MSSTARIKKLELIIQFLKRKNYATADEIIDHLAYQEAMLQNRSEDYNFASSLRTLQRDIKEIWKSFNIQIAYSRGNKGYYIVNKEDIDSRDICRLFEINEMTSLLNASASVTEHISLADKQPMGMEYINDFIAAIKNQFVILLTYQSFDYEEPIKKYIYPILLKEHRDRWYCVAKDEKDSKIKTFSLDRIKSIATLDRKYDNKDLKKKVNKLYQYAFGISTNPDIAPQEILLKLNIHQSKYLKSLPLHSSQKVISEDIAKDECIISLYVQYSYELLSEILKFGNQIEVLSPKSLVEEVKITIKKLLDIYQ